MAIVQWVKDWIKTKVASIPNNKVEKQHMPVAVYNKEFGRDVTAILEDKQQWLDVGFDPQKIEIYKGLSEELFQASTKVVAHREYVTAAVQCWTDEKDSIHAQRGRLFAAGKILAAGDANKLNILREIAEGSSNMDSVMDILTLALLVEKDMERAAKLTIGGVTINQEYIDKMKSWATEIKEILHRADEGRKDRQEEVVYRNKIIMLCREAETEMDTWLDAVYYDRPERKEMFTSDYFRSVRTSVDQTTEDVSEQIDELTAPQSADSIQENSTTED